MPLAIIYTGITLVISAFVGVGGYLIGRWCGRDQCWREVLEQRLQKQAEQRQTTQSQQLKRSDTGVLADFGRARLKREKFHAMIHEKGVRRDGGSGDLR